MTTWWVLASARTGLTAPYVGVGSLLLAGLAVSGGRIGGTQIVPQGFDRRVFPVDAIEWARGHQVRGRLFHEFEWGGYLLYAWPEQPVFIDAGTDFFTGAFMRAQGTVLALQPGWRDSLAAWRIDHALLATRSPLASELLRSPAWYPLYCDDTAVLLREGARSARDSLSPVGCSESRDQRPGR